MEYHSTWDQGSEEAHSTLCIRGGEEKAPNVGGTFTPNHDMSQLTS
jgi:hypothetical protein